MVDRGNFISLMFFVMAIGSLFINFILGWSTNVISQVRLLVSRETSVEIMSHG